MSLLVDDRALLDAFRAGDQAALATIFRHFAPHVSLMLQHGFTFGSGEQTVRFQGCKRIFDAEDLLQEVFRRAFKDNARQAYDGLRPFKTWISTITRNVVINDYQAKKRTLNSYSLEDTPEQRETDTWTASHDPLDDEPSVTGRPDLDAESGELRQLVRAFKSQLDQRELEVFQWRFEEQLGHNEIGERTGLSPSRVKTSESRIRDSLLRFMKRHGYLLNRPLGRAVRADNKTARPLVEPGGGT